VSIPPVELVDVDLERADRPAAAGVATLDDQVAAALRGSLAANTWRAYAADWRHWSAWATEHGIVLMPAEPLELARYLVDQAAAARVGTLTRRLSAIAKAHVLAGHADPTDDPAVREVLRGLRREHGTARRGAPPLWTSDVERITAATDTVPSRTFGPRQGTAEARDRALLLLAFTSALRRSELAALDIDDLKLDPAGLIVHITRSKTDPDAEGAYVGIPYASRPDCARCSRCRRGLTVSRLCSGVTVTISPARCSGRSTAAGNSGRWAPAGTAPTPAYLTRRSGTR